MAPMCYTPCLHALGDCKQHSIECGICGMRYVWYVVHAVCVVYVGVVNQ